PPTGGTPTGSVTFFIDNNSVGTVNLNGSGVATFTTSSLTTGFHSVIAQYLGSSTYQAAGSPTVTQEVRGASLTSLVSSANPSNLGQLVTFTATVTQVGGGPTPTGTVTFLVDNAAQTTVNLNGSGQATYSTSSLTGGNHQVVARYNGTTSLGASSSTV